MDVLGDALMGRPPRNAANVQRVRWFGFGACILGMLVAGSIYSFNAYSDALKAQLHLSQTQAEWLLSVGVVATCIGFTAGILGERYGVQLTSALSGILSFVGCLLSGMAIERRLPQNFSFVAVAFFLSGQGSIFFYMVCLMSTAVNFPPSMRGTLFGILDAMYGGSASLWSTIYGETFGLSNDAKQQNAAGFLYTIGATSAAVGFLCFVAVRHLPFDQKATSVSINSRRTKGLNDSIGDSNTIDSGDLGGSSSDSRGARNLAGSSSGESCDEASVGISHSSATSEQASNERSLKELIRVVDFHLLFWPFMMISALTTMYIANITFYLKAFGLENKYRRLLTIMIPGLGLVFRICFGYISDRCAKVIPRSFFIIGASASVTATLFLLRFYVEAAWVQVLNSVTVPLAAGALWCLVPTIVTELSGVKHFGQIWGVVMLFSGLMSVVYQFVYGKVYDKHVNHSALTPLGEKQTTCYGSACFSATTDLVLASCCVSLVMLFVLGVRDWKRLSRSKAGLIQ